MYRGNLLASFANHRGTFNLHDFMLVSDFKSTGDFARRLTIIESHETLHTEMLNQKDKYTALSDPHKETGNENMTIIE